MGRGLLAEVVVGRADELRVLRAGLERAAAGKGSAIVLVGEAGVGKSRLLREVQDWCGELGTVAMVGRAVDTATAVPFRALTEALLGAYRTGPVADDPDVAPFRIALSRLVPDPVKGGPGGSAAPLLHVAEGFLRVARSRARTGRACAVLLDDLQWADAETLAVVEYLADNIRDEPILVVVAVRPPAGDADTAGPPVLTSLVERRAATLVPLPRFGVGDVVEMTRECLGDPAVPAEVLRLVVDRADGLPFFVEELLAGLQTDDALVREDGRWVARRPQRGRPPATFQESVRRRVASLEPTAQQLLSDAAMLGRWIEPALLSTVSRASPVGVDAALRRGCDLGLLQVHELGIRFRHALIREAVLADLTPAERASRSRRVLTAVRAAHPKLPEELVEVAADLAEAAGEHDAAAELLLEVGRRALEHGALTSAESAQRRALALAKSGPTRREITAALIETLGLSGGVEDAFPLGEVLLAAMEDDVATADPDGSRRLGVHLSLARAAAAATDWALATAHLDRARGLSVGTETTAAAAKTTIDALNAVVALGEYRVRDAALLAESAVTEAERAGDPDLLCEALLVHGRCIRMRDLAGASAAFARTRDVARGASLAHREARALTELGFVESYRTGDAAVLRAACALAEACGAPETEAVARLALSASAQLQADVALSLEHADAGLALARRYRLGQLVPAILIMKAAALALRGDTARMEAMLAEAEPIVDDEATEVIATAAQARAVCALATDDLRGATAHLAAAAERARTSSPTVLLPMLVMYPLVAAVQGEDPRPLVDAVVRHGHDCTVPMVAGLLAAADAVRAGRHGDPAATTTLVAALDDLASTPLLQAMVARLAAIAAVADGWGTPESWLTRALATFVAHDLQAWATGCRAGLRRVIPSTGVLTDREEKVLSLVMEGLPNRSIAERLFLSPRTVEKHVERLLAKTGNANRAQLATYAMRRGPRT
jgi:DNA-binding NarL/FixJ family response regulator